MTNAPSALDEGAAPRPIASGSITMIRHELRSGDCAPQRGWVGRLLPRRGDTDASGPARPTPEADAAGHRFDTTAPAEEPPCKAAPPWRKDPVRSTPGDGAEGEEPRRDAAPPRARRGKPGSAALTRALLALIASVGAAWALSTLDGPIRTGVMILGTDLLLLMALAASFERRGRSGAFWRGFALFGWGFWVQSLATSGVIGPARDLATSRALGALEAVLSGEAKGEHPPIAPSGPFSPRGEQSTGGIGPQAGAAPPGERDRGRDSFFVMGHCALALLAAGLGGVFSLALHRPGGADPSL